MKEIDRVRQREEKKVVGERDQNIPPQIYFFGIVQVGCSQKLQTSAGEGKAVKSCRFAKRNLNLSILVNRR